MTEARKHKVLVIDDEEYIRLPLKAYLERKGYETASAADGREGLLIMRELSPSIVILDLCMPGMSGFEFLRELGPAGGARDFIVIVMTGNNDDAEIVRAYDLGAAQILRKPLFFSEVSRVVALSMEKLDLQEANREWLTELEKRAEEKALELLSARELLTAETALKEKAERELRQIERVHRILLENIKDAVFCCLIDSHTDETGETVRSFGKYISANKAASAMLGYTEAEFLALTPEDVDENKFLPRAVLKRIMKDEHVYFETQYRGKSGSLVPVEICATYLQIDGVDYAFGIARDISERKANEREILKARDAAEAAARAKTEFLANTSHEMRTPLNGIIGVSELLQNTPLDTEQRDFLEVIRESGAHLLSIIDHILDLSEMDNSKLTIHEAPFDLYFVTDKLVKQRSAKAAEKNLRLDFVFHASTPRYLRGDSGRIHQMLSNILDNAVKFTERGFVSLEVSSAGDTPGGVELVIFKIRDTGVGISESLKDKIFDKFTQETNSASRKYGGAGLGLTISGELARLMGGSITVSSVKDGGSVFTVTIPLKKDLSDRSGAAGRDAPSPAPVSDYSGKTALLVDDNEINQKLAVKMLQKMSFQVECASNGQEAVAKIREKRYDIVFMDCQMPVMDGYEATKLIRETERSGGGPRSVIIAMTAHAMQGDREKCLEAGMDDYISKPVKRDSFLEILKNHCRPGPPPV
jgi:two-component system CheB/CheR fusion protein